MKLKTTKQPTTCFRCNATFPAHMVGLEMEHPESDEKVWVCKGECAEKVFEADLEIAEMF